jgi:hypothetical protein
MSHLKVTLGMMSTSHTNYFSPLPQKKESPLPTEKEDGWDLQSVWMLWRREKSPAPARNWITFPQQSNLDALAK